ncbi:molybdenum cofactor guanylyltransferase [Erythrobacter sp. THAF29]|uniref:molybdenum cofactor guanylyltransferase n=1 Tax=Erythrobacter sp. THAF29 TaxID=2587851 RepID=UPI0012689838|nr:molybdenum cofactor guanylyltransferase [Erythrobacter sp. THAF29]
MKLLGAILAGGRARRFGSDKAHAFYEGERLIDRVGRALAEQCDAIVVCGREEPGFDCLPDRPEPGLGPLGGLNAALHHAASHGLTHVLSCGCDVPNLPKDIAQVLSGEGPAIVQSQPVVGLWPAETGEMLDTFLASGERALYAFADHVGARRIAFDPPLININAPEDLPPKA